MLLLGDWCGNDGKADRNIGCNDIMRDSIMTFFDIGGHGERYCISRRTE